MASVELRSRACGQAAALRGDVDAPGAASAATAVTFYAPGAWWLAAYLAGPGSLAATAGVSCGTADSRVRQAGGMPLPAQWTRVRRPPSLPGMLRVHAGVTAAPGSARPGSRDAFPLRPPGGPLGSG
jgi:hypothetical protein